MKIEEKIQILTDSACDLPEEIRRRYPITILSIPINVDGKEFLERVDFTNQEFYEILERCDKIPSTSQISSAHFLQEYEKAFEEGVTDLIHVTINKKGSGMYDAATKAQGMFYKEHTGAEERFRIYVIDSRTYTIAYGCGMVEAAKRIEEGMRAEEVVAFLEDWFASIEIYCSVYSLEFVKKSGRVSVAAAFMGELIGLRPIISFVDGDPKIVDKVRGDKAILARLVRAAQDTKAKSGEDQPLYYIIHGLPVKESEELAEMLTAAMGYPPSGSYEAGAAISINSGPRVIGVIIKGKNRDI